MDIYIDSADIDEIKESIFFIDGITTNPSLIKKGFEKHSRRYKSIEDYIKEILSVAGKRPVSLEINAIDYKEIISQAKALVQRFGEFGNIVVKIPVVADKENIFESLRAISYLEKNRIKTNCTLVMSPEQALMAAKADASYISIFAGRIDDYIREKSNIKADKESYFEGIIDGEIKNSIDAVEKALKIIKNINADSRLIAASIRNIRQFREIAILNPDIITAPFKVLKSAVMHKKSIEGAENFIKDSIKEYNALL